MEPVSYTHLDVYKRQTQAYATNIKETGQTFVPMIASFAAVGSNAVLDFLLIFGIGPIPKPVSYTHLDVYKRQERRDSTETHVQ